MKIYALIIDYPKGRHVTVQQTDVDANEEVLAYYKSNWAFACGMDAVMPQEPGDLISRYFEACEDRWEVEEVELPPVKPEELLRALHAASPIKVMHYGETFQVREIATAGEAGISELDLAAGEPYLVIN
jgi:hypothetical protein